jgi:cytochrome c biogenesis protein CcdA/thiol-disulfide isomerase/thioredoxin
MTGMALQTGLAFVEGLGLAFSPCILPILPLILAGGATGSRRKPFGIILGFIVFFTIFALISRQILSVFGLAQDTLQTASFVLLMIFGLIMLVPFLEERFSRLTQGVANRAQNLGNKGLAAGDGFKGGVVLGGLIGLVWTPCAGPIMAAALLQVLQSRTDLDAVTVTLAFALGAAVPMLVIALASKAIIARVRGLNNHTTGIRRAMGVLLIAIAGLGLLGFNLGVAAVGSGELPKLAQSSTPDSDKLIDGVETPYPAPEITGIVQWLNTPPLSLAQLRGKVVLIDFWTYSCINCIRTLPYIKDWYAKYKDKGLVVIGVHTPEFAFEGNADNVAAALKKFGITYPVAMDNNFGTWNAYTNKYWPAHYLIDQNGKVVYIHFGEGRYDLTEHNIRTLLGITGTMEKNVEMKVTTSDQTGETYLGNARMENQYRGDTTVPPLHQWMLTGEWDHQAQYIQAKTADSSLILHFHAKKVFLVMTTQDNKPVDAEVSLISGTGLGADVKDGKVTVTGSRLYELVNLPQSGDNIVTIKALAPGLQAYAFTFESDN